MKYDLREVRRKGATHSTAERASKLTLTATCPTEEAILANLFTAMYVKRDELFEKWIAANLPHWIDAANEADAHWNKDE